MRSGNRIFGKYSIYGHRVQTVMAPAYEAFIALVVTSAVYIAALLIANMKKVDE